MTEPAGNSNVQFIWGSGHEVLNVQLCGHTTTADGQALLDSLWDLPRHGTVQVVVDLSAVVAIDPAAASAILDAYVNTTLRGGTFKLVGLSAGIRETLRRAGVLDSLGVDAPPRPKGRQLRLVHGNHVIHPSAQVPS